MRDHAEPKQLRALLLDVDGILTDNGLYFDHEGRAAKRFDIRDGQGLVLARRAGLEVGLISGHDSAAVRRRASDLGLRICYTGVKNKIPVYEEVLGNEGWTDAEVAYMGDDLLDLPILRRCGFAATVADAHLRAKAEAHFVTQRPGGFGAVREFVEYLLDERGQLDELILSFL